MPLEPLVMIGPKTGEAYKTFTLPRLFGQRVDHQPMRLSFTILDVYRGERYDDTVITEVWFDGTDVH